MLAIIQNCRWRCVITIISWINMYHHKNRTSTYIWKQLQTMFTFGFDFVLNVVHTARNLSMYRSRKHATQIISFHNYNYHVLWINQTPNLYPTFSRNTQKHLSASNDLLWKFNSLFDLYSTLIILTVWHCVHFRQSIFHLLSVLNASPDSKTTTM